MAEYHEKNIVTTITLGAILRFLKEIEGYAPENGMIILTETPTKAQEVINILKQIGIFVPVPMNEIQETPANYQAGLHLLNKTDKEEEVVKFLFTKEYFPVLIVTGIAPTYLDGIAPVMRYDGDYDIDIDELQKLIGWIKNNVLVVREDLKRAKVGEFPTIKDIPFESSYRSALGTAEVIWGYKRSNSVNEENAKEELQNYVIWMIKRLRESERFTGVYQVSEAVKDAVYTFVRNNTILFLPCEDFDEEVYQLVNKNRVILMDDEFYWIPNGLLERICSDLVKNVTYTHLKQELVEEGTLYCNSTDKKNFTVKKIFSLGNGKTVRPRFVKLLKKALISEEGYDLDQYADRFGGDQNDM